jgi:hypothetical protein
LRNGPAKGTSKRLCRSSNERVEATLHFRRRIANGNASWGAGEQSALDWLIPSKDRWRRRESNLTRVLEQAEFAEVLIKSTCQNHQNHSKTRVDPQIAPSKIRVPPELPPLESRVWTAFLPADIIAHEQRRANLIQGKRTTQSRSSRICARRARRCQQRTKCRPRRSRVVAVCSTHCDLRTGRALRTRAGRDW